MERNSVLHFDISLQTEESTWTRSVNLMCHLLHGIDYQTLYGDLISKKDRSKKHLFDNLLKNATNLPRKLLIDAEGTDYPEIEKILTDAFSEIKKKIDDSPDCEIRLGDFFFTKRVDEPKPGSIDELKNAIIDRLDDIHVSTGGRMYHFCTPFVEVQKGRAKYSRAEDMKGFLGELNDKTLTQLFTHPRTTYKQAVAVKNANDAGILRVKPFEKVEPLFVREGNGLHCYNGNCVHSGDLYTWCVPVVHQGISYCALGSDYCQDC